MNRNSAIFALGFALVSTSVFAESCVDKLAISSPAADVIRCVVEQETVIKRLEVDLEEKVKEVNTINRRFQCAKISLDVMWKRLKSNRDYVGLAAGTSSNHGLRNSMLLEWRNNRIPAVDEKITEISDYLTNRRRQC